MNRNSRSSVRANERDALEYWTTDRMERAEPSEQPEISEQDLHEIRLAAEEYPDLNRSSRTKGFGPSAPPQSNEEAEGRGIENCSPPSVDQIHEEEKQIEEGGTPVALTVGYEYPAPHTQNEVLCSYSIFPYSAVGKLFFTRNGRDKACTAISIGNHAIWTAAHCVHNGDGRDDGWASNGLFVPATKVFSEPYGRWPVSYWRAPIFWINNGNPRATTHDMAGGVLYPQAGRKISEAVGYVGPGWNWSRNQHWHVLGYPLNQGNGIRMIECKASYAYDVGGMVTIGGKMGIGASGGPWIVQFGTENHLLGNSSGHRPGHFDEVFSPYFGDAAFSLIHDLLNDQP